MHRLTRNLLALVVLALAGCGKSPSDVAREYLDCTVRGDLAGMRSCSAGDAAERLAKPEATFAASMAASILEQMGGIDGCEILEETINGDSATVVLRLIPKQPDSEAAKMFTEPKPLHLTKVGGQWKVSGD